MERMTIREAIKHPGARHYTCGSYRRQWVYAIWHGECCLYVGSSRRCLGTRLKGHVSPPSVVGLWAKAAGLRVRDLDVVVWEYEGDRYDQLVFAEERAKVEELRPILNRYYQPKDKPAA